MPNLVSSRELQIEWGDCDPSGLVFHPRYFAFFDWSLALHFAAAGFAKGEFRQRFGATGFPSVEARGKFILPLHFGDRVGIATEIVRFGRSSFDVVHRLTTADARLAVEGFSTRVMSGPDPTNPARLKGVAIPDEMRRAFGAG